MMQYDPGNEWLYEKICWQKIHTWIQLTGNGSRIKICKW